jgi:hypothetical protein
LPFCEEISRGWEREEREERGEGRWSIMDYLSL